MLYPIIFIVGPTAVGKSRVSFLLARKINAEVIYADSFAVYKEINILSDKPSKIHLKKIPHHMIDIIPAKKEYNVFLYFKKVIPLIEKLRQNKKNIIVTGGSGLYVKAILDGIFEGAPRNEKLRAKLKEKIKTEGPAKLYEYLKKIDAASAEKISINDEKRIIRAVEAYTLTKTPISELQKNTKGVWGGYDCRVFGLRIKRNALYERINQRTDSMIKKGAAKEVKKLIKLPLSATASCALGVKEMRAFLKKEISQNEAKDKLAQRTRNFAKRQITWFKKDNRIQWINTDNLTPEDTAEKIYEWISS